MVSTISRFGFILEFEKTLPQKNMAKHESKHLKHENLRQAIWMAGSGGAGKDGEGTRQAKWVTKQAKSGSKVSNSAAK